MSELDTTQYTDEQLWFTQRFKNLVGDVLDVVDAALSDANQKRAAKKMLNRAMYDALEDLLKGLPYPHGFSR